MFGHQSVFLAGPDSAVRALVRQRPLDDHGRDFAMSARRQEVRQRDEPVEEVRVRAPSSRRCRRASRCSDRRRARSRRDVRSGRPPASPADAAASPRAGWLPAGAARMLRHQRRTALDRRCRRRPRGGFLLLWESRARPGRPHTAKNDVDHRSNRICRTRVPGDEDIAEIRGRPRPPLD